MNREKYIEIYGIDKINLAEYLCDQNGGQINYNAEDMVLYWVHRAEVAKFLANKIVDNPNCNFNTSKPKMVICIEGGCVETIYSDTKGIEVEITDFDNLKSEGKTSAEIADILRNYEKKYPYTAVY